MIMGNKKTRMKHRGMDFGSADATTNMQAHPAVKLQYRRTRNVTLPFRMICRPRKSSLRVCINLGSGAWVRRPKGSYCALR